MAEQSAEDAKHTNKDFLVGLARAFAGAIIFSFPVLMTMEMWSLGFSIDAFRLILLMALAVPLLVGLSYFIGFEDTSCLQDDVIDAFVAYAVGFITSGVVLLLFNVISFEMSAEEIIGIVSIQAVIAAIGAMLAQSELGGGDGSETGGENEKSEDTKIGGEQQNEESEDEPETEEESEKKDGENKRETSSANENKSEDANVNSRERRGASYFGEIFLMLVGAIFLAMNPAPTEEIVLISYKMSDTHVIVLALFTLLLTHAFVYKVEFRGQESSEQQSHLKLFFRFTVVGYALSLLVGLYLIWTFGHVDDTSADNIARSVVVIAFPAALGASASRLIL